MAPAGWGNALLDRVALSVYRPVARVLVGLRASAALSFLAMFAYMWFARQPVDTVCSAWGVGGAMLPLAATLRYKEENTMSLYAVLLGMAVGVSLFHIYTWRRDVTIVELLKVPERRMRTFAQEQGAAMWKRILIAGIAVWAYTGILGVLLWGVHSLSSCPNFDVLPQADAGIQIAWNGTAFLASGESSAAFGDAWDAARCAGAQCVVAPLQQPPDCCADSEVPLRSFVLTFVGMASIFQVAFAVVLEGLTRVVAAMQHNYSGSVPTPPPSAKASSLPPSSTAVPPVFRRDAGGDDAAVAESSGAKEAEDKKQAPREEDTADEAVIEVHV